MKAPSRAPAAGFTLHLVAGAWILCVVLFSALRSPETDGPEAWFRRAQRQPSAELFRDSRVELLDSTDPVMREFAFSNTFTRLAPEHAFERDLARLADPDERFRAQLWLTCRTTTPTRLTLADLDRWFESPPP